MCDLLDRLVVAGTSLPLFKTVVAGASGKSNVDCGGAEKVVVSEKLPRLTDVNLPVVFWGPARGVAFCTGMMGAFAFDFRGGVALGPNDLVPAGLVLLSVLACGIRSFKRSSIVISIRPREADGLREVVVGLLLLLLRASATA